MEAGPRSRSQEVRAASVRGSGSELLADCSETKPVNWKSSTCASRPGIGSTTSPLQDPSRKSGQTSRRRHNPESHTRFPARRGKPHPASSGPRSVRDYPWWAQEYGWAQPSGSMRGPRSPWLLQAQARYPALVLPRAAAPIASAPPTVHSSSRPARIHDQRWRKLARRGGFPTPVIGRSAMSWEEVSPTKDPTASPSSAAPAKRSSRSLAMACATI